MTITAPLYEPLTVPLTKQLDCSHTRHDGTASLVGTSLHCVPCRGLSKVVSVSFPSTAAVTNIDRERLVAAGYTPREIKRMELGR